MIQIYWDTATAYVSNRTGGCYTGGMSVAQQTLALNQMTAHLLYLSGLIAAGNTPGVLVGATIDKISVTLEPPPAPNQWQYWLQTTPYGQQPVRVVAGRERRRARTSASGRPGQGRVPASGNGW